MLTAKSKAAIYKILHTYCFENSGIGSVLICYEV